MSMIPEVKCRRCGATFSSLRSRCPNCGTRRVAQSGRTPGTTPGTVKGTAAYDRAETNTKWQMIFGLILVVAVILAVIVMVSTSLDGADHVESKVTPPVAATNDIPVIEAAPTVPPTPTPSLERIVIKFYEKEIEDFTMHLGDEPLTLTAVPYPLTVQGIKINWTVSDDSIIQLTPSDDTLSCEVNIIGTIAGGVKITAECFGVEKTITAYCVN
ncbi:MAG: hypothetical protein ACOX68_00445 [Candidatus Limivicinus sp.]